jgi:hypothetical protein
MQDPETIAEVKMMRTLRDDMTDLNKDIASLVAKIDSMPAKTRDAILADLLNAKAERQERVVMKLLTPMQAPAIDQRNLVLLKQVAGDTATVCRPMSAWT